jgi:hypothetical protein
MHVCPFNVYIKIRKAEDIFLYQRFPWGSIGQSLIAHVEMKTKQDQEELGTQLSPDNFTV